MLMFESERIYKDKDTVDIHFRHVETSCLKTTD